jgi:hypothetical protein
VSETLRIVLRAFAFLALVAAVVPACGVKPPLPRPPVADEKALIEALTARAVPMTASGSLRTGGLSVGYAECRIAADPGKGLRIDAFSPFMTPVASMLLRKDRMEVLNFQENLFVRGKPARVLSFLFEMDIDPSPLQWIICGGLPPSAGGWKSTRSMPDEPAGAYVLTTRDESGIRSRAVFEGEKYFLTSFSVFSDDNSHRQKFAIIECSDHQKGPAPIPRKIVMRPGAGDQSLVLKIDDPLVGKGPTPEELELKPLPQTRVKDID